MNVLVVGDEASLASNIAAGLNARGHDAVVAPHIASPPSLETAELAEVLAGAAIVIDVAGSPLLRRSTSPTTPTGSPSILSPPFIDQAAQHD
jgi:DNA-binding response OmpR family regulator